MVTMITILLRQVCGRLVETKRAVPRKVMGSSSAVQQLVSGDTGNTRLFIGGLPQVPGSSLVDCLRYQALHWWTASGTRLFIGGRPLVTSLTLLLMTENAIQHFLRKCFVILLQCRVCAVMDRFNISECRPMMFLGFCTVNKIECCLVIKKFTYAYQTMFGYQKFTDVYQEIY